MQNISPRQLEVFMGIAEGGSVRAAAERLHLTQPAASMALAELERQLDVELFARDRGRLHLNERGRDLLPLAHEILERLAELRRRAAHGPRELRGELRLGASNTVGNYLVGDLLGRFAQAHPRVSMRLEVDNTHRIVAALLAHRLDVGCVEGMVVQPDIEVHPWREDALVICARPDHPLARRRRLQAEDFAATRWIMREPGSATRALCERALASLPPGHTVLELGQTEAIKQAVIAGLGLAFLPKVAVGDAVAAGRLSVLHTPFLDLRRRLSLVLARDSYRGALVEAFMGMRSER
jgi:DNA-binding transcriptional LysR family regulator